MVRMASAQDERVGIFGVLDERVDGEDDELRLRLGVVHEVEVDELLLFEVFGLHVFEHVWKETADVLADGHVGDDALDGILSAIRYSELRSARSSKFSPLRGALKKRGRLMVGYVSVASGRWSGG